MAKETHALRLDKEIGNGRVKVREIFLVRYQIGMEKEVVDALGKWVTSSDYNFDRYDAAMISHYMGRRKLGLERKVIGEEDIRG